MYAYNAYHYLSAPVCSGGRPTRQKSPRDFFRNASFELFLSDYSRVYHVCVRCVRILRAPISSGRPSEIRGSAVVRTLQKFVHVTRTTPVLARRFEISTELALQHWRDTLQKHGQHLGQYQPLGCRRVKSRRRRDTAPVLGVDRTFRC